MPKSLNCAIFIANGSEEIETVTIIDILRRAQFVVDVISIEPAQQLEIFCSRGVKLIADKHFDDIELGNYQLWILPGGLKGSMALANFGPLVTALSTRADTWLASLCAAPALVLEQNSIDIGAQKTCHPDFMNLISKQGLSTQLVEIDGQHKLITAQGPGTAIAFSLAIVRQLISSAKAGEIADALTGLNKNGTYKLA
ncbi:DJ-1/PfpI family protein [Alginatibacterium sediminis]|uniref:DJ-1/PfpI family protein n=1 Tax=Alginatibacterium sediminis TaxID=2164068 RepID=A0A420E8P6_9ALTE|nr:DJ-1 family glyoxalase III [Alginatibacterium sediminis]RKF15644.1 DJ-1/PfpI family protein [Alginatibacterium sediminis]